MQLRMRGVMRLGDWAFQRDHARKARHHDRVMRGDDECRPDLRACLIEEVKRALRD
jgi:hypothetical protein